MNILEQAIHDARYSVRHEQHLNEIEQELRRHAEEVRSRRVSLGIERTEEMRPAVTTFCAAFDLSRSAYLAWLDTQPHDRRFLSFSRVTKQPFAAFIESLVPAGVEVGSYCTVYRLFFPEHITYDFPMPAWMTTIEQGEWDEWNGDYNGEREGATEGVTVADMRAIIDLYRTKG